MVAARRNGGQLPALNATARSVPLTDYVAPLGSRIMMLKVDTEGHEVRVLSSARALLQGRGIDYILWELTPSKWITAGIKSEAGIRTLGALFDSGSGYETIIVAGSGHRPRACAYAKGICGVRGELPASVLRKLPADKSLPKRSASYVPSVAAFVNATIAIKWPMATNLLSIRTGP
eukprot:2060265-Prymnesium_polylepis.1